MKKVLIVGAFDFEGLDTGGQPVKTRELYYGLVEQFGKENVQYIDTFNFKARISKFLSALLIKVRKADVIIMLPAHNGVVFLSTFLLLYKRKKTNLYYDVVGGWLPQRLTDDRHLTLKMKKMSGIWVETSSMKKALNKLGLNNISVVPNYKDLVPVEDNELSLYEVSKPIKFCTFSRVIPQKGIDLAIEAINRVNNIHNDVVAILDIYGPIDEGYRKTFMSLVENSKGIAYKGIVAPNQSVDILRRYFSLLFPTRFYTEGIPGTIIDAYASGLPIITSLWENCSDIFIEGYTGWGYPFDSEEQIYILIEKAVNDPEVFCSMRNNCLYEYKKFSKHTVVKQIISLME